MSATHKGQPGHLLFSAHVRTTGQFEESTDPFSISLAWRVLRACLSSSVLVGEGYEVSQVPPSTLHSSVDSGKRSSVAHDGNDSSTCESVDRQTDTRPRVRWRDTSGAMSGVLQGVEMTVGRDQVLGKRHAGIKLCFVAVHGPNSSFARD